MDGFCSAYFIKQLLHISIGQYVCLPYNYWLSNMNFTIKPWKGKALDSAVEVSQQY